MKPDGSAEGARHRRGPDTARAIDEAATELFFHRGYHATSMKAIGDAAGVQPAAIYHWYPNKEALLIHLQDVFMRELTRKVEAAVDRQQRGAFRLAAAVREHVLFHASHQREAFVTDSEIRALSPRPRRELIARRDAYEQYFFNMIQAGVREGDVHTPDAHVATYAILLQCTGVSMWFRSSGPITAEQVADYHVDLVLGSLHASAEVIQAAIQTVSAR